MAKVSPSILSADFANLERDLRAIARSGADYIHVDVMDGQFVPQYHHQHACGRAIAGWQAARGHYAMIDRPVTLRRTLCKAGASMVCVHVSPILRGKSGPPCSASGHAGATRSQPEARHSRPKRFCLIWAVLDAAGHDRRAGLQRAGLSPGYHAEARLPPALDRHAKNQLYAGSGRRVNSHTFRPAWTTAPTSWSPGSAFQAPDRPPSCAGSKNHPPGNSPSRRQIKHLPPCLGT